MSDTFDLAAAIAKDAARGAIATIVTHEPEPRTVTGPVICYAESGREVYVRTSRPELGPGRHTVVPLDVIAAYESLDVLTYPATTRDGGTAWACCLSQHGAPCHHRALPDGAALPIPVLRYDPSPRVSIVYDVQPNPEVPWYFTVEREHREENDDALDYGSLGTLEEALAAATMVLANEEDEDDERACSSCGERVGYLSARDWCDGCELDARRAGEGACRECSGSHTCGDCGQAYVREGEMHDGEPFPGVRVSFYRGEADGRPVVQVDTDEGAELRVNLNDGPALYDGNPEREDSDAAARADAHAQRRYADVIDASLVRVADGTWTPAQFVDAMADLVAAARQKAASVLDGQARP